MLSSTSGSPVSRRTALAGLGAGGLGVAVTTAVRPAAAQDASPASMAGHPIVGTWIIVRDVTNTTEPPVVVVFTADGSFIDAYQGATGVWEATGPNSAAFTLIPFNGPPQATSGYAVVRGTWEIDDGGATMRGSANVTVLTPDGMVVATGELSSTATRMQVEPMENQGKPPAGFPTWSPATPEAGTPTS
jgi:hypothetical protein